MLECVKNVAVIDTRRVIRTSPKCEERNTRVGSEVDSTHVAYSISVKVSEICFQVSKQYCIAQNTNISQIREETKYQDLKQQHGISEAISAKFENDEKLSSIFRGFKLYII